MTIHRCITILVLLLSFSSTFTSAETDSNPIKFKIGFILSPTGPWPEFGEAQEIALEMVRADHPALFEKIDFLYEDCQYNATNAVAAFNKLKNIDQADLIFTWGVTPSHVIAPLAEKARYPLIISAIDSSASKDRDYIIRTINYADQYAEVLARHFQSQNLKKIGIIASELTFHNLFIEGLRKYLSPDQNLEIVAKVLPDETDLSSIVSRLKKKNFDTLGLFLNPAQIINYFRHAEIQEIKIPVFGTQAFQSKSLIKTTAGKMEGAVFPHNIVNKNFADAFIKVAGHDFQLPWAANAYDFALLAGKILNELDSKPGAEDFIKLFQDIPLQHGAGGTYEATYEPEVGFYYNYPVVIKIVKGDGYQVLGIEETGKDYY